MAEHLHHILEHAEGLGMPEGDYLRVANALRAVFNGAPAPAAEYRARHRYTIARPSRVEVYDSNRLQISITLISQRRTDTGPGRPDNIETVYRYNGGGTNANTVLHSTKSFEVIVRDFLFLHQPNSVKITSDIGSYVAKYHLEEKRNTREVKHLLERLKMEGLTEEVKHHLEEDLASKCSFGYGDFIQEVIRRIPDSETIEFL